MSTPVVAIVPTTIALLDLEEQDPEMLARALGAAPPPAWPPEFNGDPYRQWQRALLGRRPDEPGYAGYYIVGGGELVGTCGFKGPPDELGIVEIGYSIIAPRRRRGYAAGGVALLLQRAFADPRVTAVVAETLPGAAASQGVLRRCGLREIGTRIDDDDGEVVRFEARRPE